MAHRALDDDHRAARLVANGAKRGGL